MDNSIFLTEFNHGYANRVEFNHVLTLRANNFTHA